MDGVRRAKVVFRLTQDSHVDVHGSSDMIAILVANIQVCDVQKR